MTKGKENAKDNRAHGGGRMKRPAQKGKFIGLIPGGGFGHVMQFAARVLDRKHITVLRIVSPVAILAQVIACMQRHLITLADLAFVKFTVELIEIIQLGRRELIEIVAFDLPAFMSRKAGRD